MPDPSAGNTGVVSVGQLPTGARYVEIPGMVARCRLLRPAVSLPCLVQDERCSRFELPAADGRRGETEQQSEVEFGKGQRATVLLTAGLPRARPEEITEDEDAGAISPTDAIERLVAFHIERCNELAFPSRLESARPPAKVQGLARCEWDDARAIYWEPDDEDGPLRLIVRIAEECSATLHNVCTHPRRTLRRVRRLARFERVQQIDDACVRWLTQQPGRTVLEKAGPRRRVLAVERLETADTPENRVVRDFLERIVRECVQYLREHRQRRDSPRFKLVHRLRVLASRLLRETEIGTVPRIAGVPNANYVLQFDQRYALLWSWYERLRRQQVSGDHAWIWRRRVLIEHARMAIAQTLSADGESLAYAKRLYVRADHDRGFFLDSRSVLTPWSIAPQQQLHLLSTLELPAAIAAGAAPRWVGWSGADLVLLVGPHKVSLVYVQFAAGSDEALRIGGSAEAMGNALDAAGVAREASVLVVVADTSASHENVHISTSSTTPSGRTCAMAVLPVPPTPGSCDFSQILALLGVLR